MIVIRRAAVTAVAASAVAVAAAAVLTSGRVDRSARPAVLEIEIEASAGSAAQLFWSDDRPAFDGSQSMIVPLQPGVDGPQRLRFVLPPRDIGWLRFDPTDARADVLIGDMIIFNADGARLGALDPSALLPLHDVASVTRSGRFLHIVSSGDDPYLTMQPGCLFPVSPRERPFRVSRASAALVSALVLALLAACALSIGSAAFGLRADLTAGVTSDARSRTALWMATLFIGVFAARLALMNQFPLAVPYQDQWDAEARVVLLPLDACGLSWRQMFSLHNEHRVFFTRLLSLDLLWLDGQWDPRLQQVVNGAMQSLTAVMVALTLWIRAGRRRIVVFTAMAAATFGLPFAWENTLQGFQSAFYFLELFSLFALWMVASHRVGSTPWWLGWLCAWCGLFTAAGGLVIPLAMAVVGLVGYAADRAPLRHLLLTLVLSAVVFAAGLAFQSPQLTRDTVLKAQSVRDFAWTWSRSLAWPWINQGAFCAIMWLPLLAAIPRALRDRSARALDPFVIGLAAWVVLQAAAIAYGRGAGGNAPASRYQDALSLGFQANAFLLIVWLNRGNSAPVGRLKQAAFAAWMLVAAVGIDARVRTAAAQLPGLRILWNAQAQNLRRFVISGDAVALAAHPVDQLAYPDPLVLAGVAGQPFIKRILPAAVRAPLRVEPQQITNDAFVRDGVNPTTPRDSLTPSWGSLSSFGPPGEGRFESRELPACALDGRLEFQVTGFLGFPGQQLRLRSLAGRETPVVPGGIAGADWRTVTVPCPDGRYTIVAEDVGPLWFGFREPIEIGSPSAIAESLIDMSPRLLLLAFVLALFASRI
jgi:hypothetical protein